MLTINHDNYETWLMLYLDNELTAAEREAVEAFAKANPAVQEELDGLKGTMLQPEIPVAMPGKERLLMPELWNEEALTPQQQQLLLLTDNELPAAEKQLLETAIAQDPLLQKEWGLLQKSRLASGQPLEMPGKDKLFRHQSTRVIPFGRVLRFAAAAAILGFGWFAISNLAENGQNNGTGEQVAINIPGEKQDNLPKNDTTEFKQPEQQGPARETMIAANATEIKGIKTSPAKTGVAQLVSAKNQTKENEAAMNEAPDYAFETMETKAPAEKLGSITVVEVAGISQADNPPVISTEKVGLTGLQTEEKQVTAYEVVNTDEPDEDKTISIAGARIPKQKIRNVYRNITRPLLRSFDKSGQQIAYAK